MKRILGAVQTRLMKPRERGLYFAGDGTRKACPPLEMLLGKTIEPGSADTLVCAQFDWVHSDIDQILARKRVDGFRHVVLCFDVIPILFPEWYKRADAECFKAYYSKAFAGADRIIFNAQSSRSDGEVYCRSLGFGLDDTAVVPLGADIPVMHRDPAPLPAGLAQGSYALFVSTIEPRKNHRILVDAWDDLVADGTIRSHNFKLVFVGRKGWKIDEFYASLVANPEFGKSILHLAATTDDELAAIYRNAAFCLYPSLYEGYGLPVVEAMVYRKPIVAARGGAVPEVLGDRGVCLDPADRAAWRDEIRRLITDTGYRESWISVLESYQPRTWEAASHDFFSAVAMPLRARAGVGIPAASTAKRIAQRGTGNKIALGIYRLSPRGGLEDHCIRIAEELCRRGHDVTIFVAGDAPDLAIRVQRLPDVMRARTNHGRMQRFADEFRSATRVRFDRTVAFQAIPNADIVFSADPIRDREHTPWYRRLGPRLRTYSSLERAAYQSPATTRVLTLTKDQAAAVAVRYGVPADRLTVLPPTASPGIRRPGERSDEARSRLRAELGIERSAVIWLWCGLQPHTKGLDRVVEALARAPNKAHLLVCGLSERDRKLHLTSRLARRLGVSHRVHPLGFIPNDSDAFFRILAAADVLAHPARADVTGMIILEAIVNGLPVVASAACGFAELVVRSGAGRIVAEPFDASAFDQALAYVSGTASANLSANGISFGSDDQLYSGIARAADLIEMPLHQR